MERGPVDHAPSASLVMAAVIKKAEEEAPPRIFATSALDVLQSLPLTSAGRPALFGSEVEIYSEENISLYDHSQKTPFQRGRCSITTHRLFYLDETKNPPVALFLPLEWITKISKEAGFLARSAKLRVDITTSAMPVVSAYIKLSFKDGGRDDFYNPLEATLKRKAWKDTQPSHLTDRRLQKRQFNAADAGIAGILRRQQAAQKETTDLATSAFSDLTNLMEKARDMVGLIERYVDTMKTAETAAANGEGGGDSSNADDINKLSSLMLDMGITSPVTRENAGGAYYQQLARQLAEFLGDYMPRNGGIMTLSDIYCMFNRARGVELVSPDDVYYAVMLQKKLKLGYHVRKFDGGLIVLQSDSHREDRVADRLLGMATKSSTGYITSSDVSIELHTSFPLAWEYLKVAEELGKICRDDTFEGTSFYTNRFDSFVLELEQRESVVSDL
ncbi:Vacuolar protein-sorting-associated protein [Globisporangium polare]